MTEPLALAAMTAYCGWDPTGQVTTTVILDGDGSSRLFLPSLYVTNVAAVVVTNFDGSTYTATLSGDFPDVGWSTGGVLTWQSANNGGRWPWTTKSISVTYTSGYAAIPDDLQAALDHLSARIPSMTGATSKRLGSAAVSYAQSIAEGGLMMVEQMVFDRYRLPRAA